MNRRSVLKSVGAAAAVPFVTNMAFAADRMAQGGAEKAHVEETMKVGATSLAESRIAVQKASGPKVMEFAKFEVAEQETIANILKGMKNPEVGMSGTVVPPSEQEVIGMVPSDMKPMVTGLQDLQGSAFDKQYVQEQIDGHNKLLAIQEQYLKVGKDREHLNVAKLAKGMIEEHLQLLQDIQQMPQA